MPSRKSNQLTARMVEQLKRPGYYGDLAVWCCALVTAKAKLGCSATRARAECVRWV